MALSRYAVMDAYTLEELRREYKAADASGRIQLLAKFRKADDEDVSMIALPPELARMATEDESVTVRQWIARNVGIHFLHDPLQEVVKRLIDDPDPFVRACLMENQTHVSYGNAERAFLFATHLERLALMRNPDVARADKLIKKIFDLENMVKDSEDKLGRLEELGISLEQRKELALAFASNPAAQKNSRLGASDFRDGMMWHLNEQLWATVWTFAAKWPSESGVPEAVFQSFAAEDHVKAGAYHQSTEPRIRSAILWSCRADQQETIKIGLADSDKVCRWVAYRKIWWPVHLSQEGLEAVLSGDDKEALDGLAENESLSIQMLKRVALKLQEIGKDDSFVERTIGRVRERQFRDEEQEKQKRADQLSNEIDKKQDELKESAIESFRSEQRPTRQTPNLHRKWIIAIALATGVALLIGAPWGTTIGGGLIGVAVALWFAK